MSPWNNLNKDDAFVNPGTRHVATFISRFVFHAYSFIGWWSIPSYRRILTGKLAGRHTWEVVRVL